MAVGKCRLELSELAHFNMEVEVMTRLRVQVLIALCLVALTVPTVMAQQKVELTLWHHWGDNRLPMMDKLVADFEKEYPWISVEHVFSSTTGAADRMGTLLISGVAPEVMMVRGTYAFQFMSHGGFLALDELVARDGIDLAMFNSGDLRTFQLLGSTYALPSMSGSAWTNLVFFNKDIMNNSGLDPNRPPQTWSDWRDAARLMTRVGENGVVSQGGTNIPYLSAIGSWNGASFWSDDWRKATVSGPRTAETMEFMRGLLSDTFGTWAAFSGFDRAGLAFWEGRSGMYFTNNSGFGLAQAASFEWGASIAPVNEKNPDAQPIGLVSSTWAYGIPADIPEEKREAAWLLLKWLTVHEEGGGWFSRIQGRPSPVIEFNRHSDYRFQNPYWDVVIAALQYDVAAPPINALGIVDGAGGSVMTGAKHPQQAMADADQQLQMALDGYWATVNR